MKHILSAVMERLQTEVSELQYVSEDWGQLDFYQDTPPVKFPCALISVSSINFESQTIGTRHATLTLLIRVADAPAVSGTMAAPESYRNRAFAIFDLLDDIGNALYGFSNDEEFNELDQKTITHYSREDAIREYAMLFETEYAIDSE